MEKEKFFIVYLEDSKTGKRIDDGDIVNFRLIWTFYSEVDAYDFAALLTIYLKDRYTVCVAESSLSDCTVSKQK